MAELNSVKVVEVCRVAPSPGSSDSGTPEALSLPLTFFDLLWLRFAPFQRIFFYEILPSSNNTNLFDSILPKLKASLSITLQHFLPLAGNITWPQNSPKPILNYVQGDTVSLTVAESDADFHRLISGNNNFVEARKYHPLVPQLAASHDQGSVMALQITLFPNIGFSIGTTMHHSALDGNSSTMFVKSWAFICKHGCNILPNQLRPFYDRSVIEDRTGLDQIYMNQFLNMDRPNNRSLMFAQFKVPSPDSVRGSFEFTSTNIEAIRQKIKKHQQEHHESVHYLSTFALTCAYVWVCLVKAEDIKSDKILLVFNVNCRSRLDPPIHANYFGNCIAGRGTVVETKDLLGEDGIVMAVNAISEAVKDLDNGVLNGAENWISSLYSLQTERVFSTAGSHRFKIYDAADFGWGKPKKTDVVSIDRTGAISFSDSKNGGGGVEIGLVLKKHYMDVFASLFCKGLEDL